MLLVFQSYLHGLEFVFEWCEEGLAIKHLVARLELYVSVILGPLKWRFLLIYTILGKR